MESNVSFCNVFANNLICSIKNSIHYIGSFEKKTQDLGLVIKTIQSVIPAFHEFLPNSSQSINKINTVTKEVKDYLNLIKGIHCVDYFINEKPLSKPWYTTLLNVSGLALFTFTLLDFVKKFKLASLESITRCCSSLPVIGTLPYAGIPKIATIGILSCSTLSLLIGQKELKIDENSSLLQIKIYKKNVANNRFTLIHKINSLINIILESYITLSKIESKWTSGMLVALEITEISLSYITYGYKNKIQSLEKKLLEVD